MLGTISLGSWLALSVGIGVFLYACAVLSASAGAIESKRLRSAFARPSCGLSGVGMGALFTAVIQSSASTIILAIGFVNAGVMSLGMSAAVIYGANIGTTVTGQLVAFGMSSGFSQVFAASIGIAAFACLVARKEIYRAIAGIFVGLGLMFAGLHLVSLSIQGMEDGVIDAIRGAKPAVLVVAGILFTAIVQSSSITTAIAISAISSGSLEISNGLYIALGSNIGSCFIVLLTGFSGTINAKRAALVHFFFNVIGVVTFIIGDYLLGGEISGLFTRDNTSGEIALAMFHTSFKVVTTIIVYPFTGLLIRLATKLSREGDKMEDGPHFHFIDELMLKNPPVAVQQLKSEVINMSRIAANNFRIAIDMIRKMDFSELDQFKDKEKELNFLNREISRFLVRINKITLSKRDRVYVSSVYHTVIDLERVGDYAENIVEYAQRMDYFDCRFPDFANDEIAEVSDFVFDLYDKVMRAYSKMNKNDLKEAFDIEEKINVATSNMKINHIQRMNNGVFVFDIGVEYLMLASDIERVADHFINIGKATRNTP